MRADVEAVAVPLFVVGTVKALAIGVNNNKTSLRYTGLRRRLEDSRTV